MRVAVVSGAALRSLAVLGAGQGRGRATVAFLAGAGRQQQPWTTSALVAATGGGASSSSTFGRKAASCGAASQAARGGAVSAKQRAMASMSASSTPEELNEAAAGVCAEVIPVPILSDNYAYLLIDPATKKTACVDPAEPEKVIAAAQARGVEISTLLCTHKHWDHSGGNEAMKQMIPDLEVVSSAYEDGVPAMTLALKDREEYALGSLTVRALHTPCHTRGHVLFFVTSPAAGAGEEGDGAAAPLVFSGDTLFVGGCGRFFEGDASQMSNALQGVAASLPGATRVFCGHEYTVSNLQFAKSVEPENSAVLDKLDWSRRVLAKGGYTVPSTANISRAGA
ncbi:unnamed protein product [Ectocarpus sp. CCAP 1310/34]|nr:unnamed protein product [Ectocarpus sp. CCAP 1310/34]